MSKHRSIKTSLAVFFLSCAACLSASAQTNYYLGPWVWENGSWNPPAGTVAVIDLRTLPQMGAPGPVAQGYGLFGVNITLGTGYRLIATGSDPNLTAISTNTRNAIGRDLGYTVSGTSVIDLLWDIFTVHSDPTGFTAPKPLMPETGGRLRLTFGAAVRQEAFLFGVHPHTEKVAAVLQNDYRAIALDAALGRVHPDLPGKVLDSWAEKYRIDKRAKEQWARMVPPELREAAVLVAHATTITESFNKADSDTLGPDLNWTELNSNDTDVVSNAAEWQTSRFSAAADANRANSSLSSADMYAQAETTISGSGNYAGAMVRKDSSATLTMYGAWRRFDGINWQVRLEKVVSGTITNLATNTITPSSPDTIKVSAEGTSIKSYHNGTQYGSVTDSAISGNTYAGLFGCEASFSTNPRADNFEAADLGASATSQIIMIQ